MDVEPLDGLLAGGEAGLAGGEVVVGVELVGASFFSPVAGLFSPSDGGFSLLE
ncbi:MAG TPA: hypothetical protein VKB81_02045 [Nitrospira sp.]|nr:hypothetical protein [Nitrospira sp.]